jgi:hypothetical protein
MGGLGFRDFELFNLALLARQAWRILQQPTELSARILKAVYFPNSDFLDAQLGDSPSRIWRAIQDGKDVLKQGLIRRIGNGEDTMIWNTNWIPRNGFLRPVTCVHTEEEPPQLVSELIDEQVGTWNLTTLQKFFLPMDVELISNIPLSTRRQEDFWAWHYDKRGVFSVRSAYRMLVDTRTRRTAWLEENAGMSNIKGEERSWTALWNIKIPSKLKVFLWRLADSLPTADLLHHRHMAQ